MTAVTRARATQSTEENCAIAVIRTQVAQGSCFSSLGASGIVICCLVMRSIQRSTGCPLEQQVQEKAPAPSEGSWMVTTLVEGHSLTMKPGTSLYGAYPCRRSSCAAFC